METPTIRPATEQDIDGLVSLYAEFHEFHVLGVPDRLRKPDTYDEATLRSTLCELVQHDDAQIFVVDCEGEIVGLAEVYVRQDESHPLTVAHRYGSKELRHDMGQFHKWSRLRNCFGMRGGNAGWPKEQDRRSFCAGLTVECLAYNEGAEDLCAQD